MTEKKDTSSGSSEVAATAIDENLRDGLTLLLQAYRYSEEASEDVWDFAVEIDVLYERNLTISDLRWLVVKEYAKHGEETSQYGDRHRSFRLSDGLNFFNTTCFVLTPKGTKFADKVLDAPASAD